LLAAAQRVGNDQQRQYEHRRCSLSDRLAAENVRGDGPDQIEGEAGVGPFPERLQAGRDQGRRAERFWFELAECCKEVVRFPETSMRMRTLFAALALTSPALAGNTQQNPTWWDKFTYISQNGPDAFSAATLSASTETNVDVSNECGPQSETFEIRGYVLAISGQREAARAVLAELC